MNMSRYDLKRAIGNQIEVRKNGEMPPPTYTQNDEAGFYTRRRAKHETDMQLKKDTQEVWDEH